MSFPPPFSSEGIRKVLGPDEAPTANALSQQKRMASLDEAELRDLERSEYYGATPGAISPSTHATPPRKSLLDRLLRR